MISALKHSWEETGFGKHKCTVCDCERHAVPYDPRLKYQSKYPRFRYFRSGIELPNRPDCRRIMHSQPINLHSKHYENFTI